jgi:hypothetical protein
VFNKAKIDAGMNDRDLHFHDLRRSAARRFYIAGLSSRAIAEIRHGAKTRLNAWA